MKKQLKWGLAVAGLVVWGTLAAVFGLYDLQISQAAYDPTARWAKWFEFAGYLVTPVILAWGAHFLLYRKTRKRRSSLIWIGHCLLATAMLTAIFFLAGGINGWVRFGVIGTAYLAGLLIILLKSWRLEAERNQPDCVADLRRVRSGVPGRDRTENLRREGAIPRTAGFERIFPLVSVASALRELLLPIRSHCERLGSVWVCTSRASGPG